uniref:Secreted protein n=1 Tax=Steinernema glaseri TaxID=37863 RepID=A0A1I7YUV5_9BILA
MVIRPITLFFLDLGLALASTTSVKRTIDDKLNTTTYRHKIYVQNNTLLHKYKWNGHGEGQVKDRLHRDGGGIVSG